MNDISKEILNTITTTRCKEDIWPIHQIKIPSIIPAIQYSCIYVAISSSEIHDKLFMKVASIHASLLPCNFHGYID